MKALLVLLLACAPASASADMKPLFVRLASQLQGFETQKAWLARLPLRVESMSSGMLARYDPPKRGVELGAIVVNADKIAPSLRALEAMGVKGAEADELVAWFLLPTVLHECQHAVQVDEYRRRGGLDVYFIESEVEAAAVEATAYLQLVRRRPGVVQTYLPLKAQQNETLDQWSRGYEAFFKETAEAYSRLMPPSLSGARAHFEREAKSSEDHAAELEEELKSATDPADRAALARLAEGMRAHAAELRDPAKVEPTIAYIAEQDANARALWAAWKADDPRSRLGEPGLAPAQRSALALEAARRLSILSPTANADEIDKLLQQAHDEAREARSGLLMGRAGRLMQRVEGRRVEYAVDIMRGRGAATDDLGVLSQILTRNLDHLRPRLRARNFELIREEADDVLRRRRGGAR